MKHSLRVIAFFMLILPASKIRAQVTQLSNNTNIQYGIALGSIGVMADSTGALWRTDGTAAGTVQYTNKVLVDQSISIAILNNKIYFAGISLTSGKELWVTDGTDAGTQLIKDIEPGTASSSPVNLVVLNNIIYFFASTTTAGVELWKSDGITGGTTTIVKDINPGPTSSYDDTYTSFFVWGSVLYFDANDGTHGVELWKTNGTDAGTMMVKDINPEGGSSNAQNFTTLGTNIIFSADDGTNGDELWKSNGTDAGTSMIQDIVPGSDGSSPGDLVALNNKVLFTAFVGAFPFPTFRLYSTDGSSVTQVKDFGVFGIALLTNAVIINSKLIFAANTIADGSGIWSSDGTAAGTAQVKQINATGGDFSIPVILPDYLTFINGGDFHTKLFNGKIFFIGDDGTNGGELWITDGTGTNTFMIKDLNPGPDSSVSLDVPSWFYTANTFYFAGNDGTTGYELYKTDGTAGNMALVADINPGGSSNPSMFMFLNKHIYLTADNGDNQNGDRDLYIISEEVVLPVTLVDFTATLNGKAVDLNWTTSTEINTKNFVVQRSDDAAHFDNIGSVTAAGSSTIKKNYSFIDAGAFNTGAKVLYYRLQMVDNDGKFSNSNIAKVEVTGSGNVIAVYPNPVKDKLVITTSKSFDNAMIKITDQSGKIVLLQKTSIQAGEKQTINVGGFGKGIYNLQFITDTNKQTTRFIKY